MDWTVTMQCADNAITPAMTITVTLSTYQAFGEGTLYSGILDESRSECQGADSGGYNYRFNEYPHSLVMSLYVFIFEVHSSSSLPRTDRFRHVWPSSAFKLTLIIQGMPYVADWWSYTAVSNQCSEITQYSSPIYKLRI